MAKKLPGDDLHGAVLTQGSVIVLSFTTIVMVVCIGLGIFFNAQNHENNIALFLIGPAFFLIGVLLCLPNLINVFKGKKKEHDIKTGKAQVEQKKSWDPKHPYGD